MTGNAPWKEEYGVKIAPGATVRDVTYDGSDIRIELSAPIFFENLFEFRRDEIEQTAAGRDDFVHPKVPGGTTVVSSDSQTVQLWQDIEPRWAEDASLVKKEDTFVVCSSSSNKVLSIEGSASSLEQQVTISIESCLKTFRARP